MERVSYYLVILLLLGQINHSFTQDYKTYEKAVDALFEEWDSEDSPGCALIVIKEGKILYSNGYGMANVELKVPITPKTVFYIGSVSKQFVAMCMLLLAEQGKIDLDADVRQYLPEFPNYGYTINIRNLIHHTSGIRDNLTLWELAGRSHLEEIPEAEIYDMICRQEELNFEPGTKYLYSNSCYFLMSLIVERVTGQSLREYAQEHIFKPLGMKHSIFNDDNRRLIANRALGYRKNKEGEIENMLMRFDLVGSGGLYSTVEDLFLWDQNFYHNKVGTQGQTLITKMLTNGKFKDGSDVGYAFALRNDDYKGISTISHSGTLGGYRAHFVQFPEQEFSVVILSNLANFLPEQSAYQVADIYLKKAFKEAPKVAEKKRGYKQSDQLTDRYHPSEKDLQVYVGTFYSKELDIKYQLKLSGNQLYLQVKNLEAIPLKAVRKGVFENSHFGTLRFNTEINGFRLDAGRVKNLKFVKPHK